VKSLRRAKFDICRVRRNGDGDVAYNRRSGGVRFRCVRVLAAVICTVADAGRIVGALYTPSGVIVPEVALPPGVPFTLQLTAVSGVFATFAENGIAFPSITDPLFGEIVTVMDGGGGGGGTDRLAPPPPQPIVHAPSRVEQIEKSLRSGICFVRMARGPHASEQAKGQPENLLLLLRGC
jgi:hypothetical protein